jgi:hypothetical protein
MIKLLDTLWSSLCLGAFGIVMGVAGYLVRRNADRWGRQAAEASAHPRPMLRWVYGRPVSATIFAERYRLTGIAAMAMGVIWLVYAAITIVATIVHGFTGGMMA